MFVKINNIKYYLHIKGDGKPLICLHGFSEDLTTWDEIELEGYQLILIDLIGHGRSDKPISRKYYKVKMILDHLNKIIKYLGYDKYSILGYSMGGRIALAYALKYQDEVEKLVLESSSYGECGFINRFKRRINDFKLAKLIKKNDIEWFEQYWSNLKIFDTQRNLPKTTRDNIRERRLGNKTYVLANTLVESGQGKFPCLKYQLERLKMPVLYITGEYDTKYNLLAKDYIRFVFNIKHVILNDVGHNTHIESKDFNKILNEFL